VLQCVAVCCSVLQCVAVCCSVLQCVAVCQCVIVCCSVLQCVAACCSVLQCALQCVAVCTHPCRRDSPRPSCCALRPSQTISDTANKKKFPKSGLWSFEAKWRETSCSPRTNESEIEQDDSRHWQQKTKKILQSQDYSHLRLNGGKHHGRPAQTSPTNWKCAKVVSDTAKNSEKSVLCQAATRGSLTLQHTATHCNTLQHTATHCNTLQHTATH